MDFKPTYIGWFVGVIILVLGYLTSTCLSATYINCKAIGFNSSASNLSLIIINDSNAQVSCKTILLSGRYSKVRNKNMVMFKIFKKEVNGYNCSFNSKIKIMCEYWSLVVMHDYDHINCTPWKDPNDIRGQKLAEILESTEVIPSRKFSLKNLFSFTYFVQCKIEYYSDFFEISRTYTLALIKFSTDTASKPNCSDFIDGPVSHILTRPGQKNFLRFKLFDNQDFDCTFSDDHDIISRSGTTIAYELKGKIIHCNKNTSEPLPFETSSVGLKEAELIKCQFKNFVKNETNEFTFSSSTEQDFIYIIKNEKREKPNCWEIIEKGTVNNYANKYLEFKLHDSQLSGHKCAAEGIEIIKRYNASFTVMSNFALLICKAFAPNRMKNAADLKPSLKKTLECDFRHEENIRICSNRLIQPDNFLVVFSNEKRLSCSSLIVDGLVHLHTNNTIQFRLYESKLSGYSCTLTQRQIITQELGLIDIIMDPHEPLKCIKMKRRVKLACWIKVYNALSEELEKNLVKITVVTSNKIQCSDIIISGHVNQTSSGTYLEANLKISNENDGIHCNLNNEEHLGGTIESNYTKIKMNIGHELFCHDMWPIGPPNSASEGDRINLENVNM